MRRTSAALASVIVGGALVAGSAVPAQAATTTVALPGSPQAVAVTPDGSTAVVIEGGAVSFVDTATDAVTRTVSAPGVALSVDIDSTGTTAIAPHNGGFDVSLITIATGAVRSVNVGDYPNGAAFDPTDDGIAYTANYGAANVTVLDVTTGNVVGRIPAGRNPYGVAFTPDGARAFISNSGSDTVTVIDTATRTPVATVPVGDTPLDIAVSPDGTEAYVANSASDSVSVIDTATDTVVDTIPVGSTPRGLAVSPDGVSLVVPQSGGSEVAIVNTTTRTVAGTVPVGDGPMSAVFLDGGASAYVANSGSNSLSRVDAPAAPTFTEDTPPADATVGTAYSYTFAASGFPAPTFSLATGVLPGGLTLSSDGTLSGTPTQSGASTFLVRATNGVGEDAVSQVHTVAVAPAPVAPTFVAATPPSGTLGSPYSYTFTSSGDPVVTYSVSSGALPAGLTLAADGSLTGTPTAAETSTFEVTATNDAGSATTQVTVTIDPAAVQALPTPTITSPTEGSTVTNPVVYTGTGTPGTSIALLSYPTDAPPESSGPIEAAFADPVQVGADGRWTVTRTVQDLGETTSIAVAFTQDTDGTVTNASAPSAPVTYTVVAAAVAPAPAPTPTPTAGPTPTPTPTPGDTAGPTALAFTGVDARATAISGGLAVLLIGAGVVLTIVRRRRTSR